MAPEVPLEQTQEEIAHHAHTASESWIMGVALTAAVLAAMAAIGSLLAEHYANEAMLEQIQSSDHWGFFQAKGIKAAVLLTKIELRTALDKPVDPANRGNLTGTSRSRQRSRKRPKSWRRSHAAMPPITRARPRRDHVSIGHRHRGRGRAHQTQTVLVRVDRLRHHGGRLFGM